MYILLDDDRPFAIIANDEKVVELIEKAITEEYVDEDISLEAGNVLPDWGETIPLTYTGTYYGEVVTGIVNITKLVTYK